MFDGSRSLTVVDGSHPTTQPNDNNKLLLFNDTVYV